MSGKYLIFGATGSIGSNLSKMMAENNKDVQLIGRSEESLKSISSETGCKFTAATSLSPSSSEESISTISLTSSSKRSISDWRDWLSFTII